MGSLSFTSQMSLSPSPYLFSMANPFDIMNFSVKVLTYDPYSMTPAVFTESPILCSCCRYFFENAPNFFRTILSPLLHTSTTATQHRAEGIIHDTMCWVQQQLGYYHHLASTFSQFQCQHFSFFVVICVFKEYHEDPNLIMEEEEEEDDEDEDDEEEDDEDEDDEDDEEDFKLIPASNEVIQTLLKESKVTKEDHCCTICLEEFHHDDGTTDEGYAMPCNHVFHKQCIVSWLQTSHRCPLCRRPLPTKP